MTDDDPWHRAVRALEAAEAAVAEQRLGLAGTWAEIGTGWATLHVGDAAHRTHDTTEEDA